MAKRGRRPKYRRIIADKIMVGNKVRRKDRPQGHQDPKVQRLFVVSQAQSIIDKFGGAYELAKVLKAFTEDKTYHFSHTTIYRWMYPREVGGQGGEIPSKYLAIVLAAARFAGIYLTPKDIYPHLFPAQSGEHESEGD